MIAFHRLARPHGSPVTSSFRKCYLFAAATHHPRSLPAAVAPARRNASTETGEDDSGHIPTAQDEGIFFFDNIFPLKIQWLAKLPFVNPDQLYNTFLSRVNKPNFAIASTSGIIQQAIPGTLPLTVTSVLPRLKEGGAFVKFKHDPAISSEDLEATLKQYMQDNPIRPWFNPFRRVRAALVKGKPWLEDLYRFPSTRLKVEFLPTSPESSAAELTQETLYSLFRRYGKLAEITPQPADSKVLPRYAYVDFSRLRFATMAKNTMHGFILVPEAGGGKAGTVLKLSYEARIKTHWIRDWITGHPRIVIPIIVALLTAASVAVFDPIRTMFIRLRLTHGFHLHENTYYKLFVGWLNRGYDMILFRQKRRQDDGLKAIWEDRKDAIEQLRTWLIETADTFIVIQGPRGAGKKELVMEQALKDVPNKLVIDCKRIQEARGDSNTIAAAAAEVGYKPVFSWMNSISSMIDLAATATIGTKTGFSETVDNQLAKILSNTTSALKQVALSNRKKEDRDAALADDDWLEAHPEHRPVVIVDNFLHKSNERSASMVYDKMAEWGAQLTTQNISHIIFLTTDNSFSKSLSKALPDRVFHQITLGDCTPEVAKRLVIKHLDSDADLPSDDEKKPTPSQLRKDLDELDNVIQVLGGRLTDLEFLARRIKAGESPGSAVRLIIEQSASEILKMYLLDHDRTWTPQQAWYLIKELALNESLRYNELLVSDILKDGDAVLQALEQAEMITISSVNGRPTAVRAGKPVYQAAFERLLEDEVLQSRMELAILTTLIGNEAKTIDKAETELKILAELPGYPPELKPRIRYLLAKAAASHDKIEKYEQESGKLKKVLRNKY